MAEQGFDFNKLAQQMGLGMGNAAAAAGSKIEEYGDALASMLAKLIPFMPNFAGMKNASLGAFDTQGQQDKNPGQALAGLSIERKNGIAQKFKPYFTVAPDGSIVHKAEVASVSHKDAHIEPAPAPLQFADISGTNTFRGLQGEHISPGDLGGFSPGGVGGGGGIRGIS